MDLGETGEVIMSRAARVLVLGLDSCDKDLVAIMILTAAVVKKALSTGAQESSRQRVLDHATHSSPGLQRPVEWSPVPNGRL